jgi:hypothetical protein
MVKVDFLQISVLPHCKTYLVDAIWALGPVPRALVPVLGWSAKGYDVPGVTEMSRKGCEGWVTVATQRLDELYQQSRPALNKI